MMMDYSSRQVLQHLDVVGRILCWAIELGEFNLIYYMQMEMSVSIGRFHIKVDEPDEIGQNQ